MRKKIVAGLFISESRYLLGTYVKVGRTYGYLEERMSRNIMNK